MTQPEATAEVETIAAPLSADQRAWLDRAQALIDDSWITERLVRMVETPSPFGEERAMAVLTAGIMREAGLDAFVQDIDALSANAIGRLGAGDGPSLLLFAPLDSPFTGRAEEEVPWVGDALPAHMQPRAVVADGRVTGLSADNPKGHIAALIASARAVALSGAALTGRVTLAFGAGGAPANGRQGEARQNVGHGAGCNFMLRHGIGGDFAIIAKPGFRVAWEEVGLCWFRVRVRGVQAYVGRRHVLTYRNPIVEAAPVITALERWFGEYARRHTDGVVAPQGAIGAIQGGWPHKPAFTPAACDLYVDLRISPRTSPMQAQRELDTALAEIRAANPGLEVASEMIVAIPGHTTDPRNWVIQTCLRAWEESEGQPHRPFLETSGQTEAVILRAHGIPTARFGLPAQMSPGPDKPVHSMGGVEVAAIRRYARCIAYAIIDTCCRGLEDVGLRRPGA
ncbi:MAG: M20 family metallopeptidase [Rhodospirillales bacterium]